MKKSIVVGPDQRPSPEQLAEWFRRYHRRQFPEIVAQMERGALSPDHIQALIEHRNPFEERGRPEPKVVKTFVLHRQFASTEEAILAASYAGGYDPYISSATYPMREGQQPKGLELVALDFSDWDHHPSTPEAKAEAKRLGHSEPLYEDQLRLGAEYPQEQYERPFVALHDPDADGNVLCLSRWGGGRRLDRDWGDPGERWEREDCLFVFRRG